MSDVLKLCKVVASTIILRKAKLWDARILFMVAFFQNATVEFSSEALCVSVCVWCFCTITQKEIDLGI